LTLALVGIGLLAAACRKQTPPPANPNVLAKVGTNEILVTDFKAQWARRGGPKPETVDKQALLEEMIGSEVLLAKALQDGLDRDPAVQRSYRNLLIGKLKERDLNRQLEQACVSAEEMQHYYEQHRSHYAKPDRVRLAVLFLETATTMRNEEKAELKQRMQEARQKALSAAEPAERGFGSLAIYYSEDQATRYKGGDIGWVEAGRDRGRWSRLVIEAGFALKNVGDVSEVLTDDRGVYLVRLLGRAEASVTPLTEVEAALRHRLLSDKRRQIEKSYLQELRKSFPIETHPERLAGIAPPPSAVKGTQPPSFP
jgi:hypothetical protein